MKNKNQGAVRKLAVRSLKNNRMRNTFIILAIILTCMLFTTSFSLVSGMMQAAQEQTMHEVGGRAHAGLKSATREQYEAVTKDPRIKKSYYNIFISYAENIVKRQTELRYVPYEDDLSEYFIQLEEGHFPEKEKEIIVDTFVMDELGVEYKSGETIHLTFSFMGEVIEKDFIVSGWYEGDRISHASEIIVSQEYWEKLKGNRTDADFVEWGREHPNDRGVGLYAVNFYFDNASNLQEKVCSVISDAGYVPETELDYGVNWAYMENRMDSADPITFVILAGVVGVILLTGYLIIYNIFQISVMNDIRFYGLLKTIGATKSQLKKIITFQAMLLSLIGIPIGICLGYGVGKLGLPFAMRFIENGHMEISLKFNLFILLFSVFFSVMTVYLSCRRPGKIAGGVSPVEAVRYTDGRNKKKSWVVITAISLSMILLTFVMTAVGSFRLDSYLESRIVGDFLLGSNGIFSMTSISDDYAISEDYLEMADGAEGIISKDELWARFDNYVKLDEKGINQYKKLDQEGKLRRDEYTEDMIEWVIEGKEDFRMYSYGYTNDLLEKLEVLEGTLDIEKFQEGDYILIGRFHGSETLEASDGLYHPGDYVKVAGIAEGAKLQEIKNDAGETIGAYYDKMDEKVYEVMAVIDIPYSMDLHRYTANAMDVVLPLREFTESEENSVCFALSYKVEKEKQEAFEAMLKDYTENTNKFMGYASKDSLKQEFDGMIKVIAVIGISLAAVIAFIGILNFVNAMITDIISRKREFAVLQSIGMTGIQLVRMLILEGVRYVAAAGVISFIVGSLLARIILGALNNVIMFFEYQFQIMPFIIMLPVLLIVAVIVPWAAWHRLQKKSIVERLRENE